MVELGVVDPAVLVRIHFEEQRDDVDLGLLEMALRKGVYKELQVPGLQQKLLCQPPAILHSISGGLVGVTFRATPVKLLDVLLYLASQYIQFLADVSDHGVGYVLEIVLLGWRALILLDSSRPGILPEFLIAVIVLPVEIWLVLLLLWD